MAQLVKYTLYLGPIILLVVQESGLCLPVYTPVYTKNLLQIVIHYLNKSLTDSQRRLELYDSLESSQDLRLGAWSYATTWGACKALGWRAQSCVTIQGLAGPSRAAQPLRGLTRPHAECPESFLGLRPRA
jgi:hypothetical protein